MTAAEQPSGACAACGVTLSGRYCHACGQDTEARPRPLREMALEAFSETSVIDGVGVRTLVAMVTRPGRILIAYREGAGSLYASPIKIFVVVTALFLAVLNFRDIALYQFVRQAPADAVLVAIPDPDGQTVHVRGAVEEDRWMQRRIEPAVDPRIWAAVEAAAARTSDPDDRYNLRADIVLDQAMAKGSDRMLQWLPNTLWLLMPLYALLLAPLFGRRRLFMEHLVFAMWAHATAFVLLMLLALVNSFGIGAPAWLLAAPFMAYFVLAARRYYEVSTWSALWRGTVHMGLYLMLVLFPVASVIMFSGLDLGALAQAGA
jgi:hypothetical protein